MAETTSDVQVFRPFFTTRLRGTGLGLAIVQKGDRGEDRAHAQRGAEPWSFSEQGRANQWIDVTFLAVPKG